MSVTNVLINDRAPIIARSGNKCNSLLSQMRALSFTIIYGLGSSHTTKQQNISDGYFSFFMFCCKPWILHTNCGGGVTLLHECSTHKHACWSFENLILPRNKGRKTHLKMLTDKWRDRQTNGWTTNERRTIICLVHRRLIQKYELYCINSILTFLTVVYIFTGNTLI